MGICREKGSSYFTRCCITYIKNIYPFFVVFIDLADKILWLPSGPPHCADIEKNNFQY